LIIGAALKATPDDSVPAVAAKAAVATARSVCLNRIDTSPISDADGTGLLHAAIEIACPTTVS
jgi:hypothetical protein